jgi:hypothetical protein
MAIIVCKTGGDFVPPPEGEQHAVCVDVIDLGVRQSQYGPKRKVCLVWELPEHRHEKTGHALTARKWYTRSLNDTATLRKDLESWRGKPFSTEELAGFDLEQVVGACCKVVIQHAVKNGTTYGNVIAVLRTTKNIAPSGAYIRRKDRPTDTGTQPDNGATGNTPPGKLPF